MGGNGGSGIVDGGREKVDSWFGLVWFGFENTYIGWTRRNKQAFTALMEIDRVELVD